MNRYCLSAVVLALFTALSVSAATTDTVAGAHAYDSLYALQQQHLNDYRQPSVSADTLCSPVQKNRWELFSTNAVGIAEMSRLSMQTVFVPITLSSNLNRSMINGFSLPPIEFTLNNSLIGLSSNALRGFDRISSPDMQDFSIAMPDRVNLQIHPNAPLMPETEIFWENGVFYENTLNVRYARPLSKNIALSVYSNNRYCKSENYSTGADIQSLYSFFVADTNLTSQGGKNPLTNEHETGIRIVANGKNGEQRYAAFSYNDAKNETSYEHRTSYGQKSLLWDKISQYGSAGSAGITGLALNPIHLNVEARYTTEGHTRFVPEPDTATKGKNTELVVAGRPYLSFSGDTLSLTGLLAKNSETTYSDSEHSVYSGSASLSYGYHTQLSGFATTINAEIGQHFVYEKNNTSKYNVIGKGTVSLLGNHSMLQAYVSRAALPYPVLFDTIGLSPNTYNRLYNAYGAQVCAWYGKVGFTTGINGVSGIDSTASFGFWPHGVMPYKQPGLSLLAAPMFTGWHGLSLTSRWIFSNSRPTITSQTILSLRTHPLKEHIMLDLIFDFWSKRDDTNYGGISAWNREIYNLSLRTTLQVKSFCLYSKIDNILNRKYAYVPGYWMPGLTFRWGFHWFIPG